MTLGTFWSLMETPVILLGAGLVLAIVAFTMLDEYRRIFTQDPRAAMSAEVFMAIVTKSGGPGYMAAFVLAGALCSWRSPCITWSTVYRMSLGSNMTLRSNTAVLPDAAVITLLHPRLGSTRRKPPR